MPTILAVTIRSSGGPPPPDDASGETVRRLLADSTSDPADVRRLLSISARDSTYLPIVEAALRSADRNRYQQLIALLADIYTPHRINRVIGDDPNITWQRFIHNRNAYVRARDDHAPKQRAGAATHESSTRLGAASSLAKASKAPKKKRRKSKNTPASTTMTCRECLRAKPLNAFPDPSRRRCADCGGQPPRRSVRTVSGGLPGSKRR
jgi:hypothetical protein